MKVYIGPDNWFGPYQFADLFKYVGASESFRDRIAEALPLSPFQFFHDLFPRKVKVKIHDYDVWGADHTLAQIIHPVLVKLQSVKHGAPHVDDEDVPENLRTTSAPAKEHEWDIDDNFFMRWDYVLGEMIFAFGKILDETWELEFYDKGKTDKEGFEAMSARIANGTKLFGKYYRNLWD